MKVKIETDDGRTLTGELTEVPAFKVGQKVLIVGHKMMLSRLLGEVMTVESLSSTHATCVGTDNKAWAASLSDIRSLTAEEAVAIEKPKRGRWLPEYREQYETIDEYGDVCKATSNHGSFDRQRFAIGNVYRVGEAEKQVERIKAIVRINDWIAENCEEPKSDGLHYYPCVSHRTGLRSFYFPGTIASVISPVATRTDSDRLETACADDLEIVLNGGTR